MASPYLQRLAVTTHEHITLDNILRAFGLFESCLGPRPDRLCRGEYNFVELRPGAPLQGRSGYAITLHIELRRADPSSQRSHTDAPVLLQLDQLISRASVREADERLTTASVAHAQWPSSPDSSRSSSISTSMVAIKLKAGSDNLVLPEYVECPFPGADSDISHELLSWGFHGHVFRFGDHHVAACFSSPWTALPHSFQYMFCNLDLQDQSGAFMHTSTQELCELDIMRFLSSCGYRRAAVHHIKALLDGLFLVQFQDVHPAPAPREITVKIPPSWPSPLTSSCEHRPIYRADSALT